MVTTKEIAENLIKGQAAKVKELVNQAVKEKMAVKKILSEGLINGMAVVGDRFKKNEFYVPEVLIAARAMHAGMEILEPLLAAAGVQPLAKACIGTVKGDLHDIGKNLVSMMLRGAGFNINDLGIDVSPEKFIEAVRGGSQVVCMSALLTTTMTSMKVVLDELKKAGIRDKVKVMVGGAPLTQNYADEIGADGYAPDAASAVDKAKELLKV